MPMSAPATSKTSDDITSPELLACEASSTHMRDGIDLQNGCDKISSTFSDVPGNEDKIDTALKFGEFELRVP
jgi:hypothetical protein